MFFICHVFTTFEVFSTLLSRVALTTADSHYIYIGWPAKYERLNLESYELCGHFRVNINVNLRLI